MPDTLQREVSNTQTMEPVYIGTKVTKDEHYSLRCLAAGRGESLSGFLRNLALAALESGNPSVTPRRKKKGALKQ